jgi:hypothetical protein
MVCEMSASLGALARTSLTDLGIMWMGVAFSPSPWSATVFSSSSSQDPPRRVGLWKRMSYSKTSRASRSTPLLQERSAKIFSALEVGPPASLILFKTVWVYLMGGTQGWAVSSLMPSCLVMSFSVFFSFMTVLRGALEKSDLEGNARKHQGRRFEILATDSGRTCWYVVLTWKLQVGGLKFSPPARECT